MCVVDDSRACHGPLVDLARSHRVWTQVRWGLMAEMVPDGMLGSGLEPFGSSGVTSDLRRAQDGVLKMIWPPQRLMA